MKHSQNNTQCGHNKSYGKFKKISTDPLNNSDGNNYFQNTQRPTDSSTQLRENKQPLADSGYATNIEQSFNEQHLSALKPGPDGKVNWTPLADLTGTRPAVHKYSLARYSLEEWTNYTNTILDNNLINQSETVKYNAKNAVSSAVVNIGKSQLENYRRLRHNAKNLFRWKVEVENACKAITQEVELLENDRQRLKGASRVLMLPESITKECLILYAQRASHDLVADIAKEELVKERDMVSEIRNILKLKLEEIDKQMEINKAAKHRIEYEWGDKTEAYNTEALNMSLNSHSSTIMFKPGAVRFGDNTGTIEIWEYFCKKNLSDCESVRQRSMDLRGTLNALMRTNGERLRNQADKTNIAVAEMVTRITELCTKLELKLKQTLQSLADMEKLIHNLQSSIQNTDKVMKLAQTRLENRNKMRSHGESVADHVHIGLLHEVKMVHETVTSLLMQLNNAEATHRSLMEKRIVLEKDIAAKKMTLNIYRDRCGMIRSHYPSASELAGF